MKVFEVAMSLALGHKLQFLTYKCYHRVHVESILHWYATIVLAIRLLYFFTVSPSKPFFLPWGFLGFSCEKCHAFLIFLLLCRSILLFFVYIICRRTTFIFGTLRRLLRLELVKEYRLKLNAGMLCGNSLNVLGITYLGHYKYWHYLFLTCPYMLLLLLLFLHVCNSKLQ